MKTTKKAFDCVKMKNAIQARLIARRKGMSSTELVSDIEQSLIHSSQPIAAFWRRISSGETRKASPHSLVHH